MSDSVYIITHDGKPVGITRESEQMGGLSWFHDNCRAYSMEHALKHEGYTIEQREPDCREVADIMEGIAGRLGIVAEFEFVPFSRSRNAKPDSGFGDGKPWKSLNWIVRLKRTASSREPFLETDYGQGVAYAPASSAKPRGVGTGDASSRYFAGLRERAIDAEIETGRVHEFGDSMMMSRDGIRDTRKPVPEPRLGDVLQSLASDSRVLDEGGFEQWAESLGYDTDSRKAESIYRACTDIAAKLQSNLGRRALEELQLAGEFN